MSKIDKLDRQILRMIAEDARVPFLEVARACNVSGAAIHQRIQKLTSMGVLKGSQFLIDPEKISPELVIAVPVGFVNVIQAKELIMQSGVPCITARGRKGGSNIAACICNALLYMLEN